MFTSIPGTGLLTCFLPPCTRSSRRERGPGQSASLISNHRSGLCAQGSVYYLAMGHNGAWSVSKLFPLWCLYCSEISSVLPLQEAAGDPGCLWGAVFPERDSCQCSTVSEGSWNTRLSSQKKRKKKVPKDFWSSCFVLIYLLRIHSQKWQFVAHLFYLFFL